MKTFSIFVATVALSLSALAQDNREFKEETIRVVDQAVAANQLNYSLVGHPRDGESQSSDGKIRLDHTSGDIASQLVDFMKKALSGPTKIEDYQVSFNCNNEAASCELSIVVPLSEEDQQNGHMDRGVLRFSLEMENGHPVRIKDNRLSLHLYAAGVQDL